MFRKKQKEVPLRRTANPQMQGKVFSYYSGNPRFSNEQTDAVTAQKTHERLRFDIFKKLPVIGAATVIIIATLYLLSIDNNPRIVIEGPVTYREEAAYQAKAQEVIGGSILNKNKLTFQQAKNNEQIKQVFPEAKKVSTSVAVFGRRPTVRLTLTPVRFVLSSREHNSYIVNESGTAVADVRELQADSKLLTVNDETGLEVKLGNAVLSSQEVSFISEIIRQFEAKGVHISSLTLPPVPTELDVHLTGESYVVKFGMREDARQSAGAFFAANEKLHEKAGGEAKEYIDVRVAERVYYK